MAERLELIARIGAAIERAPDEATRALLNDALAALVEDHGLIAATERRREKDRRRKRADSLESGESTDSAERAEGVELVPPSPGSSFPEPHITPSSPPSAAAAGARETPPMLFDAVASLLSRIPEASRPAWRAELAVVEQGMHGPAMTPEQVQRACRDYLGNGNLRRAEPSMRHFRAYLSDAARPPRERRPTTKPAGSDYDADAAWAEVLELLPLWQRREPDIATRQQALPKETRRGLSTIGGFRVIAETPDNKRVWLKQDFAKAFAKAPTTTTATVP